MTARPVQELPTPALLLDLGKFERNVRRMHRAIVTEAGIGWRPHVKSIRAPALAEQLVQAGALGVTCSTIDAAEEMVAGGIGSVLIASQLAGAEEAARLAQLQARAEVIVGIDGPEHIDLLEAVGRLAGARIPVVVEVNIGVNRAGVEPGRAAVELAASAAARGHVEFAGLFGWEGGRIAGIQDRAAKAGAVAAAVKQLTGTADLCRASGFPVRIVSCGGTGTYAMSAGLPGVTEIQAGGGVFGDLYYQDHYGVDHECALTVLATVISRPAPDRIVCDSGWKSMGNHHACPQPLGIEHRASVSLSAEHATINLRSPSASPRVGDKIEFVVGYCDATTFLHDQLHGVVQGRVTMTWPIPRRVSS